MKTRLYLATALALSVGACAESTTDAPTIETVEDAAAFDSRSSALELTTGSDDTCEAVSSFALNPDYLAITADVTTTPGEFTVEVDAIDGQQIEELRLWFGAPADIPLVGGAPDFDAFPVVEYVGGTTYAGTFDQPVTVACGEELKVALYILASDGVATDAYEMYIYLGTCCDDDVEEGCTLTQGYWKNHNQYERGSRGTAWPIDENTELCGMTWLEILETPPRGDAWFILAHQWIAATLNDVTASTTPEVDDALSIGADLLAACEISCDDRALAIGASELLDAYNNGEVGPGHCDGETESPTSRCSRGDIDRSRGDREHHARGSRGSRGSHGHSSRGHRGFRR